MRCRACNPIGQFFSAMNRAEKRLRDLDNKCLDLQSYALLAKTGLVTKMGAKNMEYLKSKYPEDCELIEERPEYYLGFYEGAQATARLMLPYMLPEDYREEDDDGEGGIQHITKETLIADAEEDFPDYGY